MRRNDDDLVIAVSRSMTGEEQALLRCAEPRRRAGGEDDASIGGSTVAFSITTRCEGGPSPAQLVDRKDGLESLDDLADDRILRRQASCRR